MLIEGTEISYRYWSAEPNTRNGGKQNMKTKTKKGMKADNKKDYVEIEIPQPMIDELSKHGDPSVLTQKAIREHLTRIIGTLDEGTGLICFKRVFE